MATEMFDAWVRTTINGTAGAPLTAAQASTSASVLATTIYERWCTAVSTDRRTESEWFAEVSHSLQRASRVLGSAHVIG